MLPNIRIGIGYDIHPIKQGRRMVLGGVDFALSYGLDGHSDADVLTHAICDALLGAAGLSDIGHFFPNTDPAYAGVDSLKLLESVCKTVRGKGWQIVNIDTALIAEKPKVQARLAEMKSRLAESAQIQVEQIGIKATTNEALGSLGRGEGIAAHATALIHKT